MMEEPWPKGNNSHCCLPKYTPSNNIMMSTQEYDVHSEDAVSSLLEDRRNAEPLTDLSKLMVILSSLHAINLVMYCNKYTAYCTQSNLNHSI